MTNTDELAAEAAKAALEVLAKISEDGRVNHNDRINAAATILAYDQQKNYTV